MAKRARVDSAADGGLPTFSELPTPLPILEEYPSQSISDRLLSAAPERLNCSICFEPCFPDLRQCLQGHTFHLACITDALTYRSACPECRSPLTVQGLARNLHAEDTLNALQLRCCFQSLGCAAVLTLATVREHESGCDFRPCKCASWPTCDWTGNRSAFADHWTTCPHRVVVCVCGIQIAAGSHAEHARLECKRRLVACPLCATAGIVAADMETHVSTDCAAGKLLLGPMLGEIRELRSQVSALQDFRRRTAMRESFQSHNAAVMRVHIFTAGVPAPLSPPTLDLFDLSKSRLWIDLTEGDESTLLEDNTRRDPTDSLRTLKTDGGVSILSKRLTAAARVAELRDGPWEIRVSTLRQNGTRRIDSTGSNTLQIDSRSGDDVALHAAVWMMPALGDVHQAVEPQAVLFIKFHTLGTDISKFKFLGHIVVKLSAMISTILPIIRERAQLPAHTALVGYEELEFRDRLAVNELDLMVSYRDAELQDGDILWFQLPSDTDTAPIKLREWMGARRHPFSAVENFFLGDDGNAPQHVAE